MRCLGVKKISLRLIAVVIISCFVFDPALTDCLLTSLLTDQKQLCSTSAFPKLQCEFWEEALACAATHGIFNILQQPTIRIRTINIEKSAKKNETSELGRKRLLRIANLSRLGRAGFWASIAVMLGPRSFGQGAWFTPSPKQPSYQYHYPYEVAPRGHWHYDYPAPPSDEFMVLSIVVFTSLLAITLFIVSRLFKYADLYRIHFDDDLDLTVSDKPLFLINSFGNFIFRIRKFESHGRLYERLGVKRMGSFFHYIIRKNKSKKTVYQISKRRENFVLLTKYFEAVHLAVMLLIGSDLFFSHTNLVTVSFKSILLISQAYLVLYQRYTRGRILFQKERRIAREKSASSKKKNLSATSVPFLQHAA